MPIPALDEHGFLPPGVHDCTLQEIKARFGSFQRSDRRPILFQKLQEFVDELRGSRIGRWLVINGSFVTLKSEPNDIDLILIVIESHDFSAEVRPAVYNVLSSQRVRGRFGFDLLVARENSEESRQWIEFFQQVRLERARQKGIIRIGL